ncbi:MAG: hypothetical protein ACP6IQ_02245 [Candidatus Njordarchaeia archaeon]
MAAPVINNLTANMSSLNEEPIVAINFYLQHDDGLTCEVATNGLQYQLDSNPGVWYNCTLDSSTSGTNLQSYTTSPGKSNTLYWCVKDDLPNKNESVTIRLNLVDSNSVASGYSTSSSFNIKTTNPTLSFTLDDYTNQLTFKFIPTTSNDVTHYKISESDLLSGATWIAYNSGEEMEITWTTSTEETKNVYVQVRDQYFNKSSVVSDSIILHTTPPSSLFLRINGTIPNNHTYTGIKINSDGSFTSDLSGELDIYADDLLDIQIYIDGDIQNGVKVRQWVDYKVNGVRQFDSVDIVFNGTTYNYDHDASVTVQFKDKAGNISTVSKSIRVNTKILKCHHTLLREQDSEYKHQLYEVGSNNNTNLVNETVILSNDYIRAWDEIFYPESHDYPRESDGTIDEQACINMNGVSNAQYDAVVIESGQVKYDEEDRPITTDWTKDGTKDYNNMESSYSSNLRYWIIDNSDYGDIDLEFEYFFIDPNSYGPPYNNMSPYKGDCLVVYDASAEGCLQETIGPDGKKTYTLLDSTKLVELYAYTGKGNQVMELSTGYSVNANTNGGFSVPTIRTTSKICIILYTDASHTASGFKIKAGPKHEKVFRNYDVDERNGEVWYHKYPNGQAYNGELRMVYDYYDTDIQFDLDNGEVIFKQDPSGVITADYSYYVKDSDKESYDYTRMFIAHDDDFVDYIDPDMYATPFGQTIDKTKTWTVATPSGKITSNYTVDKDRGVIEFYDGQGDGYDEYYYIPKNSRITLDYHHHTFKRLSNDGHGILIFKDETLVADDTPVYPDYTWTDVKIVNEGDAILENGKLKFLARGYDNDGDGTIDQVLDVNRPWDVQEGTAAETYERTAMEVRQNYTFDLTITRDQAYSIVSNWKNKEFGFDIYPRTKFYGRVVWCLWMNGSYPQTSIGRKTFSAELSGKFYNVEV